MVNEEGLKHEKRSVVSFNELTEMAARGNPEDWAFIDEQLKTFPLSEAYLSWAINGGLASENRNVRDFAMTLLNVSDLPLPPDSMAKLSTALQDEYHVVRIRAAIAMRKRGSTDAIVEHILRKAVDEQDPDLGSLAEQALNL